MSQLKISGASNHTIFLTALGGTLDTKKIHVGSNKIFYFFIFFNINLIIILIICIKNNLIVFIIFIQYILVPQEAFFCFLNIAY